MTDTQNITAGPAAQITVVDVFAKVIEMQATLAVLQKTLEAIPDHESRLRVLEASRAKMYGAVLTISALVSAGGAWVGFLVTRGHG